MNGLLENKVCIVTGAAGVNGIGRATAKLFHEQGATVVIADLDMEASQKAAAEIGNERTLGMACNVVDKSDCEALVSAVLEQFGRIDVLISNAGITQPIKTLDLTGDDYDKVTDVSLRGMLYMSQAVLPTMISQGEGSIACTSSVSAQRGGGILGGAHYSAAKAGMLGLAKAMAREFGGQGVRVNAVAPGLIRTDINAGKIAPEKEKEILAGIPLGRLGNPTDVAMGYLFLASDLSRYITGSTIDINGGMHIH